MHVIGYFQGQISDCRAVKWGQCVSNWRQKLCLELGKSRFLDQWLKLGKEWVMFGLKVLRKSKEYIVFPMLQCVKIRHSDN